MAVPQDGLVAYYPFHGNADDASGNDLNGVVFEASLTTDPHGDANNAYDFDGIDDYIEVADDGGLLTLTGLWTVAAGVWPDASVATCVLGRWYGKVRGRMRMRITI